jgi:hypothetical protein
MKKLTIYENALDTLAHSYTYNPDGTLQTVVVQDGSNTYTKTYTYTNGQLTSETGWVKS